MITSHLISQCYYSFCTDNLQIFCMRLLLIMSPYACMKRLQGEDKKSLVNCFHPLEGFAGRAHGRCIQGQRGDPNTEFSADMCCWAADKHLHQLHSSFPENLKKMYISRSIIFNNNTAGIIGVSATPITPHNDCMSQGE